MNYFVTGATGFIGRFLLTELLHRDDARVFALVRTSSRPKLEQICRDLGVDAGRLQPVTGDLAMPGLGLEASVVDELKALKPEFFHLAAIYDLSADAASQQRANIEGTRHALEAAAGMQARCFHHVSSIAAGGEFPGVFTENMFDEACGLDDPYFYTKHESEKLVRDNGWVPWRVYRPSMVVGDSRSGVMDKVDGPYFLFRLLRMAAEFVPSTVPLVGIEGGQFNIVPVDYVVKAMVHIAHREGLDGRCFHLTANEHYSFAQLSNLIAVRAGAPRFRFNLGNAVVNAGPRQVASAIAGLAPVRWLLDDVMGRLGIPASMLGFLTFPTTYDRAQTAAALAGTGIEPPALEDYIDTIWRYWDQVLEPKR